MYFTNVKIKFYCNVSKIGPMHGNLKFAPSLFSVQKYQICFKKFQICTKFVVCACKSFIMHYTDSTNNTSTLCTYNEANAHNTKIKFHLFLFLVVKKRDRAQGPYMYTPRFLWPSVLVPLLGTYMGTFNLE